MRIRSKPIVRRELMKHQGLQKGGYLSYANPVRHSACFMEMRLGKTLATIRWVMGLPQGFWYNPEDAVIGCYPILVAAPLSVIEAWEKELNLEYERYVVIHGKSFAKRIELAVNEGFGFPGRNWILINYDALRATPGLSELEWFAVILDESTHVKNIKAKITKLCTTGFKSVEHKSILAGLPAPESELDLFSQFMFLDGSFMNCTNFYEYRNRYFELTWEGWKPKPGMAAKIKDYVHSRSFILTRQQAGLGSVKIREVRKISMLPEQARVYKKLEDEFVAEYGLDLWQETDHVLTQRMWLARIAGGSDITGEMKWPGKIKELISLLKGELANQPIVVWFRFTSEIETVATALRRASVAFQTLTGADSRDERKRKQEWFRTSKQPSRVMLVQIIKVAEYGVDMSISSTAIYYSVTYSCLQMSQTEDRILHPMKKEPLLYIYLCTENTIDEDAIETVRTKVRNSKLFLIKMKERFLARRGIKK